MAKIAVEKPFDDIKSVLEQKGHQVEMFVDNSGIKDVDLGVVRHLNEFDEAPSNIQLVIADGKSVDEVVKEVEDSLNRFS